MSHVTVLSQRKPDSFTFGDRRVSVRYPSGEGRWKVLEAADPNTSPVILKNLSVDGVCLDADRPFRFGALLNVDLEGPCGKRLRKLARVVQAPQEDHGRWVHHCLFIVPLGEAELR
jgi:hypothetical protein